MNLFVYSVICDRWWINWPFTAKYQNPVCYIIPFQTFVHNDVFFPYNMHVVLFSSYTTAIVMQLIMCLLRNVYFQFRIRTPFTKAQELIASFSTNTYRVRGPNLARRYVVDTMYDINTKSTNYILYSIFFRTKNLHFVVNGKFMHRRSHIVFGGE